MLPPLLPLFPLPNVVLFPNVFLPLHIFEARYRQMVDDALEGDRIIGMVLLRPGHEAEYERRPPVYGVGCAGLMTHAERLGDGRFNIVLRGLERFRILDEEPASPATLYRRAVIAPLAEPAITAADRLRAERQKLEALLMPLLSGTPGGRGLPANMADEDLINALSQYLALDPIEKQALLERDGPLARCQSLAELLEMRALTEGHGGEGRVH
jgi:Lon protease-like protein